MPSLRAEPKTPPSRPAPRSNRARIWRRGAVVLLSLWALIAIGIWSLERAKPSLQKTINFVHKHPVTSELPSAERESWIEEIARRLNRLEGEERLRVLLDPQMRISLSRLSDEERQNYLRLTTAKGLPEMLEGFRKAKPDRRLRWIDVALNELEELQAGARREFEQILTREVITRIAQEGIAEYLNESGVSVQVRLQPLLERIQHIVQVTR